MTSATIVRHGLEVTLPSGWDGSIYWRSVAANEVTQPVLQAGTFGLPPDRGDFGGGAVELMAPDDVFVALVEYGPESSSTALFATAGIPRRLPPESFSPWALQRVIPGQAGLQRFFNEQGRAFCLYVVLGSFAMRAKLSTAVNVVIGSIQIGTVSQKVAG